MADKMDPKDPGFDPIESGIFHEPGVGPRPMVAHMGYADPEPRYTLGEAAERLNMAAKVDQAKRNVAEDKFAEAVTPMLTPDSSNSAMSIRESLRAWWLDTASKEVEPLIDKMFEYGGVGRSNDLMRIGKKMVDLGVPSLERNVDPEDGEAYLAELGVYFYIEGKMARWSAAVAEGRPVSDDTLLDIGIYVRMVQRMRAVGGWPV